AGGHEAVDCADQGGLIFLPGKARGHDDILSALGKGRGSSTETRDFDGVVNHLETRCLQPELTHMVGYTRGNTDRGTRAGCEWAGRPKTPKSVALAVLFDVNHDGHVCREGRLPSPNVFAEAVGGEYLRLEIRDEFAELAASGP